ncbi:Atg14 domain-containing protein [Synechococcus sp. AH-601-B19]|nr:Atg14 domain-containing protein [Synechococcus sp. AH-601-B19]
MSNVPPKDWDPPEHLSLSEREFLVDRAETINGIIAASYLQVGQVLLQVKRKFKRDPDLNGWFSKWVDETMPFSINKANKFLCIAEGCEDDARVLEAVKNSAYTTIYEILTLESKAKEHVLELLLSGEKFSQKDVIAVKKLPQVELERLKEQVESMEMTLLECELSYSTATDPVKRGAANYQIKQSKQRLSKTLAKLNQKEEEVNALGKERSTQDLVLQTLRKQLKQKEVVIENMSLDPEQKRKRALAQTVVDATKGLDLLLSSIDRYGTDKPELGLEAINTIERKMDEVKSKLLEHYADLSETGDSS